MPEWLGENEENLKKVGLQKGKRPCKRDADTGGGKKKSSVLSPLNQIKGAGEHVGEETRLKIKNRCQGRGKI